MKKNYLMPSIKVMAISSENLLAFSGAGSGTIGNGGSIGGGDDTMQPGGTGGVAEGGTEAESKKGTWDSWD